MKIYKKAVILLAGTMLASTVTPLYASSLSEKMAAKDNVLFIARDSSSTTSAGTTVKKDTTDPDITSVSVEKISGDMYLIIKATDNVGVDHVTVDGSKATLKSTGKYEYKITKSKTYEIRAYDKAGNYDTYTKAVDLDADPTLTLSKTKSGSTVYMTIKASDDKGIKKVTVNDEDFDFPLDGGSRDYKITSSGKYTVIVTDKDGNTTKEYLNFDLDNDAPTVELSKSFSNGKCYLVIKVSPNSGSKIDTVKLDGKTISCDKKGEELKKEVTKTGTYKVVVKDTDGLETTKSIYIDINEATQGPDLSLTVTPLSGTSYLTIQVSDSYSDLSKLTVNGQSIAVNKSGGIIRYAVTASGNYTVVATNANGITTTKSAYVTVQPAATTQGSHTVIFKLNQRSWTLDGVVSNMDAATMAKNGRIYIPLRYVSNALGIDAANIRWDGPSKTVIIYDGSNVVKVGLGKNYMTLNNKTIAMDSPAIQVGGRVMVPISQVSKAFTTRDVKMLWDDSNKQVIITRS